MSNRSLQALTTQAFVSRTECDSTTVATCPAAFLRWPSLSLLLQLVRVVRAAELLRIMHASQRSQEAIDNLTMRIEVRSAVAALSFTVAACHMSRMFWWALEHRPCPKPNACLCSGSCVIPESTGGSMI